MRPNIRAVLVFVFGCALFIAAGAATTFSEPFSDKANLTTDEKKLSSDLIDLVRASEENETKTDDIPGGGPIFGAPVEGGGEGTVYVYVTVDPAASTHVIDAYAEVTDRDEEHHIAAAMVPVASLADLVALPEVISVMRVLPPLVNAGSVETQGDTLLRAKALRNATGYGGAGMRIGIISDGIDHMETAVASGDLPGDVHVLSNTVGGDEGTAMLEIVHDIAPDADLYFHDCGSNEIAFNTAVDALAVAGCTVICDDIAWLTVPYFEDGSIASHIQSLVDQGGIVYVSSAGNYAKAHYQGGYVDGGNYWHNFGGGDIAIPFTIPPSTSAYVILEWSDRWGLSSNDYDLAVCDASGTLITSSASIQDGNDNPLEYVGVTNPGASTATVYIVVQKYSGYPRTLEIFTFGASIPSPYGRTADSVFGHQAAAGVVAVGALDYAGAIRDYSSRGPSTISYPVAVQRGKPDISATDGVSVTGAGGFPSTFYGTSAAAPHVAAIAALVWGLAPDLSAAEVQEKMLSTAEDLGTGGVDTIYGYGRVDAFDLFLSTGEAPTASFTAAPLTGQAPLTVDFTDLSVGAMAWQWSFGDGGTSTAQHPSRTYAMPGTYTVSLTASSLFGSTTAEKAGYVTVTAPALAANISANRTGGTVPLTVQFVDESIGMPDTWNWAFGDGGISTEQHPVHTYTAPDTYTVTLTVSNANGQDTVTETDFITTTDPDGPGIAWQRCLGGSDYEYAENIQKTSDGGYIVAGETGSTDGDFSGNHGIYDAWVVKLDASGGMVWQRCLGGSDNDHAYSIQQTTDGGYIVAGYTFSTDGDVSGNHGNRDAWVVKLDATGNVVWQRCLGGSNNDYASSIQQTADGGYVVAGYTESTDGDVIGNHGNYDFWVVKLDAAGSMVWQRCLGGSAWDSARSIQQTSDGGYVVAGDTHSYNGDVSGNHGYEDAWVVKLDASGGMVWQRCFGGSSYDYAWSIQQTTDGGYVIAGQTQSTDGDFSGNHGIYDAWVVKLDASGGMVWQRCLGGSSYDYAWSIQQTTDGGYVVAGRTESTDGDASGNHGDYDAWVVKLDATGNVVWQRCLGGSAWDSASSIQQTADGGYVVAAWTVSTDGDVSGNHGNRDGWVVKLEDTGFIAAPVAIFTASVTSGTTPLTVQFTDTSANSPVSWLWTFGDTTTSTDQHPTHTYAAPGNYTVTLAVNDGADTCTRPAYIKVTPLLYGDANEDGEVNQADTLRVLREVVGLSAKPTTDEQFRKTDVHTNGVIEVGDALFIAQYNVGLRDVWFEII